MLNLKALRRWIGGWTGAFAINALIATYFLIFGVGFGIWAALSNLVANIHHYSVFAKCYQVSCNTSIHLHFLSLDWARSMVTFTAQTTSSAQRSDHCGCLALCMV